MSRALLKTVGAVAIVLLSAVAYADTASAGDRGTTQVAGLLEPDQDGSCTANPSAAGGAYDVSGSLVGCWYVDTFTVDHESHVGGFVAHGTETFDGCLGSTCGHIFTTYTFTAKFDGDTEAHGRCHHPISEGDGGFAGVSGVIEMKDLPNGCAAYKGHVTL
jgi:hypothetical protein